MKDFVNILIVEDDFSAALNLEMLLDNMGYTNISTVDNGEDAIDLIQDKRPDIILMDIYLKGKMTGIDVASKIQETNIPFIYLTSSSEGQDFDRAKYTLPLAYLPKPFNEFELRKAIELAIVRSKFNREKIEDKDQFSMDDDFFLKMNGKQKKISVKDILWIKSDGNYCLIFTQNQKYIHRTSLVKLKEKLPISDFVQIHRRVLVQYKKIEKIDSYSNKVILKNTELPLGRTFKNELKEKLNWL
jgi:DNA-binding LytR/AlgR family response regulator